MRIAVVTLSTKNYYSDELEKQIVNNHQAYCDKNGYDYYFITEVIDSSRHPSWNKVLLVQQLIPQYDYLLWIDADAVFSNYEIKLESIINETPGANFIICRDQAPWIGTPDWVNCGVFIVRNCDWTIQFLIDWWAFAKPQHYFGGFWDQSCFYEMLFHNKSKYCRCKEIAIIPQKKMNSFPCNWTKGDFIMHHAGEKDKSRIQQSLGYIFN